MSEKEYSLAEGDVFLLPTNAMFRIHDKLDDASDQSSVYSNEADLAIEDEPEGESVHMDRVEFAQRLYQYEWGISHILNLLEYKAMH